MPYTEKTPEYWRERKRQQRMSKNNVQEGDVQETITEMSKNVTLKTRPNRMGADGRPEMVANEYDPEELLDDGSKRYLGPLSDGQVLDRTMVKVI